MMNRPGGVAGNIVWSVASRAVQAAVGFAAAIAVARHLSLTGLGEYLSAMAVAGAVMSVSYCGIQMFLVRETGSGREDAGALLGAGLLVRLSIIVLAGFGAACWAGFSPPEARAGLAAVAVALCAEAFRSLGLLAGAMFQARERMRPECLLALLHAALWGGLLTVAIALGSGPVGLLAASCLALAGHCLASWAVVARGYARPRLAAGARLVLPMLRGSLVIGLSVILVQNLFRANVLVLERFGTPEEVAFFQTPHDLVLRFQIVFQAVMLAAFPALARLYAAAGAEGHALGTEMTAALGRLMAAASCGLALALFLFADPLLGLLYGAKLLPAASCLRILALSCAPLALGMLWAQALIAAGRQRQALLVNAFALIANLGLSLLLIPRHGITGASVAALAAYTIAALGAFSAGRGLLAGGLATSLHAGCLAALGGGLLAASALPAPWGGMAGLATYAALLLIFKAASPRDIRVLGRCVRPM